MSGAGKRGQVRIIGGRWRGRKLPVASVAGLRPTGHAQQHPARDDRGGELEHDGRGLFAGTGALAFEALSRGAATALMFETAGPAVRQLYDNAAMLGASADIEQVDARRRIARGCGTAPFDIVFIDPPFADADAAALCTLLRQHGWLADAALVYIEQSADRWQAPPAPFVGHKEKRQGQVHAGLFRLES